MEIFICKLIPDFHIKSHVYQSPPKHLCIFLMYVLIMMIVLGKAHFCINFFQYSHLQRHLL